MSVKNIYFVLGGPACGKGTLCTKLSQEHNFTHISVGDLMRNEVTKNGTYAKLINEHILNGTLVSSEIVVNVIKNKINEIDDGAHILIDGFPRNIENYNKWHEIVEHDDIKVHSVIVLDCDDETMLQRIKMRQVQESRSDDNDTTFANRINVYRTETFPNISFLGTKYPIIFIDAKRDKDIVYIDVWNKIKY